MKKTYITPAFETVQMVVESSLMTVSINGSTTTPGNGEDMNSNGRDFTFDEEW